MAHELNLLPPSRRQFLDRQLVVDGIGKLLQTLIIAWTIVIVAGVATAATLTFFIMTASSGVAITLAEQVKVYKDLRTQIGVTNTTIKTMQSLTNDRVVWSTLLPDVFASLPPGTLVGRVSMLVNPAPHISFAGSAAARSSLVVLQSRLGLISWVGSIDAPDSNLLERDNPSYQFDITVKTTPSPSPASKKATSK